MERRTELAKPRKAGERRGRRTCISCDREVDVGHKASPSGMLCPECRAPLRALDFPDVYCDLGDGD